MIQPHEQVVNDIEQFVVTHGIIKAFEDRGYGLCALGFGPMMFTNIDMIMEFAQDGRVKDQLEVGRRYLPLPLLKDNATGPEMRQAIGDMVFQLRGPYFIEIQTNPETGNHEAKSNHLIDSIFIEPPFLNIVTDVKFGYYTKENTIVLHLLHAAKAIRKQLMMSTRGALCQSMTTNAVGADLLPNTSTKVQ